MFAFRQILDEPGDFIPVPPVFKHRRTEVIFLMSDAEADGAQTPQQTLASLAGSWEGDDLERAPQGDYDQRDTLD